MTATTVATRSEFSLLADLAAEGSLTTTALTLDPSTSYDTWEALGTMLGRLTASTCWIVGDWVNFGEALFGEQAAQAMDATGLAYQTIANYASVARRVPPERRRATLPYSYHAVVAPLEPADQDAWLERAEREGWQRRELEAAVHGEVEDEARLTCPNCNGKGWITP